MMRDEPFGVVTWDESSRAPSGRITLANGRTWEFSFDVEETDEADAAALRTLKFLAANELLIRQMVAFSTVRYFQDTWFDSNPVDPDELARKINLHVVQIHDEGVELYYTADDEDDIFTGHWLLVPIDADGGLGEPQLEG